MTTTNTYKGYVDRLNQYRRIYPNQVELQKIAEYTRLYDEVVKYEKENPNRILPESPTQSMENLTTRELKTHLTPMWHTQATSEYKDIERFWEGFSDIRATKGIDTVDHYYCDYKTTGLPVELWYKDRKLILALTYGDGHQGEDVTLNMLGISSIPQFICYSPLVVIRGNVVVHRCDYDLANHKQKLQGAPEFTSMEHYINYCLHLDTAKETQACNLKFFAWDIVLGNPGKKNYQHSELMRIVANTFGFIVPDFKICSNVSEIKEFILQAESHREELPYVVEGVTIRQDSSSVSKVVGFNNSGKPNFQVVYKFKPKRNDTEILSIRWQMGRTGRLTPYAQITPLELDDATVTEVKLDNAANMESRGLDVGARITICRTSDGSARINEVLSQVKVNIPDKCPYCGAPAIKVGTDLRCTGEDCREHFAAGLRYLLGHEVLDIPGITPEIVTSMVATGVVTKLPDIFLPLESKSKDVPQELLDTIVSKAREISMSDLIVALNIPRVSKSLSWQFTSELVSNIDDLVKLMHDEDKLKWNLRIPPSVKADLIKWFQDEKHLKLLDELKALNLPNCS